MPLNILSFEIKFSKLFSFKIKVVYLHKDQFKHKNNGRTEL